MNWRKRHQRCLPFLLFTTFTLLHPTFFLLFSFSFKFCIFFHNFPTPQQNQHPNFPDPRHPVGKIKTLASSSIAGGRCAAGGEFACFARVWFWWWSPSGCYSGSECSSMDSTRSKTLSVSAILAAAAPPAEEDPSSVMHRRHCSSSPFSCSISLLLIVLGICLFPFIN